VCDQRKVEIVLTKVRSKKYYQVAKDATWQLSLCKFWENVNSRNMSVLPVAIMKAVEEVIIPLRAHV